MLGCGKSSIGTAGPSSIAHMPDRPWELIRGCWRPTSSGSPGERHTGQAGVERREHQGWRLKTGPSWPSRPSRPRYSMPRARPALDDHRGNLVETSASSPAWEGAGPPVTWVGSRARVGSRTGMGMERLGGRTIKWSNGRTCPACLATQEIGRHLNLRDLHLDRGVRRQDVEQGQGLQPGQGLGHRDPFRPRCSTRSWRTRGIGSPRAPCALHPICGPGRADHYQFM